jgi:adenosylmethionine-8-amino-7-oxononanoate aminotransferase
MEGQRASQVIAPGWGANSSIQLARLRSPHYFTLRYKNGTEQELADFSSGSATNLIGIPNQRVEAVYSNPEMWRPFVNYGVFHPEKEKLASRLLEAVGFDDGGLVYRASTGTQASTTAIKLAWLAQFERGESRKLILSPRGSYFGHDPATLAAGYWCGTGDHDTGESYNNSYLPDEITNVFQHLPSPVHEGTLADHLDNYMRRFAFDTDHDVAALMLEPVQFVGATTPREDYYDGVMEVARKHGILVIVDECATFGRFGDLFASRRLGLEPDIYTAGKGLSNSYEKVAAVVVSPEVVERVNEKDIPEAAKVMFGSTLDWQPRDAYVANAILDEVAENDLLQKGLENSQLLQRALEDRLKDEKVVVQSRGGWSTVSFPSDRITGEVRRSLMRNYSIYGYRSGRGINLLTPLVGTDESFEDVADAVLESYREATA